MSVSSLTPSGTIENAGVVMLSSKELLAKQMNLAAQNLSNGDTVGFKGLMLSGLESVYRNPSLGGKSPSISFVQGAPVHRDTAQGSLKQTGNPFDFALNGAGYFAIQVGEAKQFTRDGRFRMDNNGKLVTMDGYSVQGDNGDINLGAYTSFSVLSDGTILGFDTLGVQSQLGKIQVTRFNDEQKDLEYVGIGRFLAVGEEVPIDSSTQVMNNFLEQSNVNPITESVRLMRIMQVYEESQRITEMDDAMKTRMLNARASGA